jgi:hypothetical protein
MMAFGYIENQSFSLTKNRVSLPSFPLTPMVVHITDNSFMALGLKIAGYKNLQRSSKKTNIELLQRWFQAKPKLCAQSGWTYNQQLTKSVASKGIPILCTFSWLYAT